MNTYIETPKISEILKEEFGTGAFSMLICQGMSEKDTAALKAKVEQVDHVKDVLWYDSFLDLSVPMEMLPDEIYETFNTDDATMLFAVFSDTSGSASIMGLAISRVGFICDTVTMWAFIIPIGCIAAFVLKLPVLVVYFLLNLDEIVKLPVVIARYRQFKWVRNIVNDMETDEV